MKAATHRNRRRTGFINSSPIGGGGTSGARQEGKQAGFKGFPTTKMVARGECGSKGILQKAARPGRSPQTEVSATETPSQPVLTRTNPDQTTSLQPVRGTHDVPASQILLQQSR